MNTILRILNIFFVGLGIIFFIVILGGCYVWLADPFHIFSWGVSPASLMKMMTGKADVKIDNVDKNPLLTEQQEAQLEAIGINPATLPSQITPAMKICFAEKLGQERAGQIMGGSSPTPMDFFKVQSCFSVK